EWTLPFTSIDQLRKNLHYPLYPHTRTTVLKLAASPQWTNYGLRIFGYLHPYADGEFVFAVSSQANSEFWLSANESPLDCRLQAWVGKTGSEWTAPGEYNKFASQTSRPHQHVSLYPFAVHLISSMSRYRFHSSGSSPGVLSSSSSSPAGESSLFMSEVDHIPQTAGSHPCHPPGPDMLREDPRDTFYRRQMIPARTLRSVLPDCSYSPSYIIKGYELLRYQGLQFVHMTYIHPNDYTRLTHMETENSCFYHESEEEETTGEGGRRWKAAGADGGTGEGQPGRLCPSAGRRCDAPPGPLCLPFQRPPPPRPAYQALQRPPPRPPRPAYQALQRPPPRPPRPANQALQRPPPRPPRPQYQALQRPPPRPPRPQYQALQRPPPRPPRPQYQRAGTNHTDTSTVVRSAEAFWDEGGARVARGGSRRSGWDQGGVEGDTSYEEAAPTPLVFDPEVVWSQTFQADQLDLQLLRSDWIDLNCNVSGNLLLQPADAQAVVRTYVDKLNLKHQGRYTLVRVVNVEKRVDRAQGSRYLLELELKDPSGELRRLSHYVYSLIRWKKPRSRRLPPLRSVPEVILCNPFGFQWNPTATVHFIVPVKNQARWVIQLISDMEALYRVTRDRDFSLIIVDYDSTDMDVKKALDAASLPQYEYLKLSGNFQRAAGLQAGVDLITDDHSIVFLCDLHISFPMAILDSIRKHCVEGYMAFAPILMRLDCGATPQEPRGYWEVNGFGLLSVYKSDLLAAGGMNTREFTDRWGGEDWELLDRILQSGLEVERIHLRNFFHYYHSKRGMWNRRTMSNSR
uniref:Hexosyltransferase n=1 Tax=Gadus morhua TaxID=8049 RepID=A0A8C4ZT67_GADMO